MQTWLITGVSSGLGRAMAEQVLAQGGKVVGTVRDTQAVQDLAARYPDSFRSVTLELTDTHMIPSVVDHAFGIFDGFDVVVNNAGYGQFGVAESLTIEQIRQQIDTNLIAPIEVARAALPYFRAQGKGKLIAISSYGGQATHAGASLYHASKWGLEGFFEALAAEVAGFGIGVTIVEPGAARTAFRAAAAQQLADAGQPYQGTPLGGLRAILTDPARMPGGDPQRMAAAIVESASASTVPLRLVLGSDAQAILEKALTERLEAVRQQAETARETDMLQTV